MALSLLTNSSIYSSTEVLSGALYQVRWVEYAAVLAMGFDFFRAPARAWTYLKTLMVVGVIVSLLGFIQLQVFPDFTSMVPQGWDPHVGRLLSTWFDPNFLAGWLSFLVTITTAVALSQPWRQARWWWVANLVMTLAIILTFSRSGYVALVAGVGIVTLFRSRTLLFIGLIGMVMTIMFVPRVQERVIGIRTVDETAQLRIVSWKNAFEVISDYPWLGVGYNVYKYVQIDYGFLDKTNEHSASGSDSSLLSIWVTTGILGLLS
jgi:O-antigen ligase